METARQFQAMNVAVPETLVQEEEAFPVWRENCRAVSAFLRCETQWRAVAGFGFFQWLGIDYAAARPVFERRNGRVDHALFEDIRVMERAALDAVAEVA